MWDSSNDGEKWGRYRISVRRALAGGVLLIGVGFAGWYSGRLDTLDTLVASDPSVMATSVPTTALDFTQSVSATLPQGHSLDDMIRQLAAMQGRLVAVSGQFDTQRAQAEATPVVVDIPAALAEIERLNQQMLPLMKQIEVAVQTGRPAGELAAMRREMDEIHRTLTVLLDAVAVANPAQTPTTVAQIQQMLIQVQQLLAQFPATPAAQTP